MMPAVARRLSGWGRFPVADCLVDVVRTESDAGAIVGARAATIARGAGRSYGDPSLNRASTATMLGMARMLDFDPATGLLTCEAGVQLADVLESFAPRGWFPLVTPGTKFVTIGGMVASDVHGKNHHKDGSFCDGVEWIDLLGADGRITRCSREANRTLFEASRGGMGLTGMVLRVCFRLQRIETTQIVQRTFRARDLDAAIRIFEGAMDATYSVAWIDCLAKGRALGRSAIFLGEHARVEDLPAAERDTPFARPRRRAKNVPIDFPGFALSSLTVRLFNMAYYKAQREGHRLVPYEPYFYPLDAIGHWNRIYGRRGFAQYQCVLPLDGSREGLIALLEAISAAGLGSFLAVLKRLGAQSGGMLSFPMPGYTLALDFPVTTGTFALFERLDAIVLAKGGRLYLAKDSRMPVEMLAAGYPRLAEFQELRAAQGLDTKFCSLQSERLEI